MENRGRIIGFRHRIKQSKAGEARPTQVAILEEGKLRTLELASDTAELDFVRGIYPVKMRKAIRGDVLDSYAPHHISWRDLKPGEDLNDFPANLCMKRGRNWMIATHVPDDIEGFAPGDVIVTVLGGSGDRLSYALSRRAERINGSILRVAPFILKEWREKKGFDKEKDAASIIELYREAPQEFQQVTPRDRQYIFLCKSLQARVDAMKARMACEQRLRQRLIGEIFCNEDGFYGEGDVELAFDKQKTSDAIFLALQGEEKARNKDLEKALKEMPVYNELFAEIQGCGPAIASRIIAGIQDIRRFSSASKLKAYCGTHVLPDGRFPRKRTGEIANWKDEIRQALYLLGDQFNRRPDSVWGKKLREYKAKHRAKHPEVVVNGDGKKKYTDAHIHRMATWSTLTKFTEWLWREWWKLEKAV